MSLLISGATIIDCVAKGPIEGQSIWVERGRIKAIGRRDEIGVPSAAQVIDAHGKYVIPGLMNANVHLQGAFFRMEDLVRYEHRYEELIAEAAQVALMNGLTTVFDTYGPRLPLMSVRDKINSGQVPGSRIFCAGNIVGLDGPFSEDFFPKMLEVASDSLVERINALYVENVGPALSWMTPDQVAKEVRVYIGKGIDFIKFASSEHRVPMGHSAFLAFPQECQTAIVEEAHRAGITAQAHTTAVEALRVAIEAGCDIIQHCNITGPAAIPDTTLELIVERKTACTVFPFTKQRYDWAVEKGDVLIARLFPGVAVDTNVRNLIQSGAALLLANDGMVLPSDLAADPFWASAAGGADNTFELGQGHFTWLKAMEEKGLLPLEGLKAATRNIAVAYRKDEDLGTLEPDKIADILVLDKNPLQAAENYRSIHMVIKDGAIVDRSTLPLKPILTKAPAEPSAETLAYRAHRPHAGSSGFPFCCAADLSLLRAGSRGDAQRRR